MIYKFSFLTCEAVREEMKDNIKRLFKGDFNDNVRLLLMLVKVVRDCHHVLGDLDEKIEKISDKIFEWPRETTIEDLTDLLYKIAIRGMREWDWDKKGYLYDMIVRTPYWENTTVKLPGRGTSYDDVYDAFMNIDGEGIYEFDYEVWVYPDNCDENNLGDCEHEELYGFDFLDEHEGCDPFEED